jgi:hypothetical protein
MAEYQQCLMHHTFTSALPVKSSRLSTLRMQRGNLACYYITGNRALQYILFMVE